MQAKVLAAALSKTRSEHWLVLVQLPPLLARDQLPAACSAPPQAKTPHESRTPAGEMGRDCAPASLSQVLEIQLCPSPEGLWDGGVQLRVPTGYP